MINKYSSVVICCPGDVKISGGVNSLHNLCRSLELAGFDSSMFYINADEHIVGDPYYSSYKVKRCMSLNDSKDTLFIVPETLVPFLSNIHIGGKMIYWLGLSLYMKTPSWRFPFSIKLFRKLISCKSYDGYSSGKIELFKRRMYEYAKSHQRIWDGDVMHLSNSHFVANYCRTKGVSAKVLHNPVRDEFYDEPVKMERERLILLGPKTSGSLLRQVRGLLPGFEVVKIRKMAASEVFDLMSKATLFVEIGNFSGRDRMPREAVLRGAAVVINTRGSAANSEDYNLNVRYKIDESMRNRKELLKLIYECATNSVTHVKEQSSFLDQLNEERGDFQYRTEHVFNEFLIKTN